jgi:hypothetical protein
MLKESKIMEKGRYLDKIVNYIFVTNPSGQRIVVMAEQNINILKKGK